MSLAVKYAMKKRMAKGGNSSIEDVANHFPVDKNDVPCCAHGGDPASCKMCYGGKMSEGGEVHPDDDDLVMRIMKKRYSVGGEVANDTPPMVDGEENDFDDLALDDDLEFSETGKNSGDEDGDEQEDEDKKDIVSKIMKSRSKKDRMPRPA